MGALVRAENLQPGQTLVGDAGGLSQITGDVYRSASVLGCVAVETEHGTLYLDADDEIEIAGTTNPDGTCVGCKAAMGTPCAPECPIDGEVPTDTNTGSVTT